MWKQINATQWLFYTWQESFSKRIDLVVQFTEYSPLEVTKILILIFVAMWWVTTLQSHYFPIFALNSLNSVKLIWKILILWILWFRLEQLLTNGYSNKQLFAESPMTYWPFQRLWYLISIHNRISHFLCTLTGARDNKDKFLRKM